MQKSICILTVTLMLIGSTGAAPNYNNILGTYVDANASNTVAELGVPNPWYLDAQNDATPTWERNEITDGDDTWDYYEGWDDSQWVTPPGWIKDPNLVTTISGLGPGLAYDVYVLFGDHTATGTHWGICASLNAPLVDWQAGVDDYDYTSTGDDTIFGSQDDPNTIHTGEMLNTLVSLEQALLGTKVADGNGEIKVYVKPVANIINTKGYYRTHYDGVAYNAVDLQQVTETDGSTEVIEGGATDTIDLVLAIEPTANVTIIPYDPDHEVAANSLTFTPDNWYIPQTMTISAVDDARVELDESSTLYLSASSADSIFNGNLQEVIVSFIGDNDSLMRVGAYVDADPNNTVANDGTNPFYDTVNVEDGLWYWRTDSSTYNYNTVFHVANQNEEVPTLKTTIDGLEPGEKYEIRAVFWAWKEFSIWAGDSGWNIKAGLAPDALELYTMGFDYERWDYENDATKAYGVLSSLPCDANSIKGANAETHVLLGTAIADGTGKISAYINGADIDNNDPRTQYDGLTYQKVMLDIVETGGATVVENGTIDTFTVALSKNADGSDVVVTVYELDLHGDNLDLSTDTLTFSSGSYTVPQQVVILGKDPDLIKNTTIVLTVSSDDPDFDGYTTTVYVKELDCGAKGYPEYDLNSDCQTNLMDLSILAATWLDCSDPSDATCTAGFPW